MFELASPGGRAVRPRPSEEMFARGPGFSDRRRGVSRAAGLVMACSIQVSAISSKRLMATTSSWRINVRARFLLMPKRTES